ncbi:hypothetical protein GCM10025866_16880 [Naasia aerilata]|uniref:Phospholipase/carboxylesterase/thioesterase domain-containing protein n=1 Tax=Naasia aerilata TaxID=1162966 RepID=A0ABN6XLI5_9MICO|nr:hypothetical protein GCM10025866_16880 [Naasia aerilata]
MHAWLDRQEPTSISLVGWSQGGALAIHLMRQQPDRFVSAALVGGFVWDLTPHAGIRARRPPVWYGMGDRDDVITPGMAAASRRWLAEHTSADLVELPGESHMLSPRFAGEALEFTADRLAFAAASPA